MGKRVEKNWESLEKVSLRNLSVSLASILHQARSKVYCTGLLRRLKQCAWQ